MKKLLLTILLNVLLLLPVVGLGGDITSGNLVFSNLVHYNELLHGPPSSASDLVGELKDIPVDEGAGITIKSFDIYESARGGMYVVESGGRTLAKYPKDNFLEFVNSTFTPAQKQKFNTAKNFYESFNPSFNINELRGIDYDMVVTNVVKHENNIMYQMVTIDKATGNPKFGSYFFEEINEDITKLGVGDLNRIKADERVKIKVVLDGEVDFLKSKTANIEDWNGSGVIFEGGGNQFYNPTAKHKIKSFEIIETF